MKTEYFCLVCFIIAALLSLLLWDIVSFALTSTIAELIGLGIVIDRKINPKKPF